MTSSRAAIATPTPVPTLASVLRPVEIGSVRADVAVVDTRADVVDKPSLLYNVLLLDSVVVRSDPEDVADADPELTDESMRAELG